MHRWLDGRGAEYAVEAAIGVPAALALIGAVAILPRLSSAVQVWLVMVLLVAVLATTIGAWYLAGRLWSCDACRHRWLGGRGP